MSVSDGVGNTRQQVRGPEEQVDWLLPERQLPFLRGDEAVFHRMGHAHSDVEVDDARRAFE